MQALRRQRHLARRARTGDRRSAGLGRPVRPRPGAAAARRPGPGSRRWRGTGAAPPRHRDRPARLSPGRAASRGSVAAARSSSAWRLAASSHVGAPASGREHLDHSRVGAQHLGGAVGRPVIERQDVGAQGLGRAQVARQVLGPVADRQQAQQRLLAGVLGRAARGRARQRDEPLQVDVSGTGLGRERLAVADDVLAVDGYLPALAGRRDQRGRRGVLGVRALDVLGVPAVLELDPDRHRVEVVATLGDAGRGAEDAAGVPGRVGLVDELRDPAVEPDEVVRADAALGIRKPVRGAGEACRPWCGRRSPAASPRRGLGRSAA